MPLGNIKSWRNVDVKANVYKIVAKVLDFEGNPEKDIIYELENNRYVVVKVYGMEKREINNWTDEHPLNKKETGKQVFEEMFKEKI